MTLGLLEPYNTEEGRHKVLTEEGTNASISLLYLTEVTCSVGRSHQVPKVTYSCVHILLLHLSPVMGHMTPGPTI
jgi:hypothetical protein